MGYFDETLEGNFFNGVLSLFWSDFCCETDGSCDV